MKIVSLILVWLTLAVMAVPAQAEDCVGCDTRRMWEETARNDLPGLIQSFINAGFKADENGILSKHIGYAAWYLLDRDGSLKALVDSKYWDKDAVIKKGVYKGWKAIDAFADYFLRFNLGRNYPERITWAMFQKKAIAQYGWRVPVDNALPKLVQKLDTNLAAMQSGMTELVKTDEELKTEIAALNVADDALRASIDEFWLDYQAEMDQVKAQLRDHEERIGVNETNIGELSSRVGNLESLKQQVEQLSGKVQNLESELAKKAVGEEVTSMFAGLDKKYAGVSDINDINSRLDTLSESINERIERLSLFQMFIFGAVVVIALYLILGAIRNMWRKRKQQQIPTLTVTEKTKVPVRKTELSPQSETKATPPEEEAA